MTVLPELLVVGHVTEDHFGPGQTRLGGAASYAARAAATLGVRTALVTGAPPDWPLLRALEGQANLEVHILPRPVVTTFALDYTGPVRRLRCTAAAAPIAPAEIPVPWRRCPVAYLGAVAGECPGTLADSLESGFLATGLQGWMRQFGPDGSVLATLGPETRDPPVRLRAATLSVEDHPQAVQLAAELAARGIVVTITEGAKGARLFVGAAPPLTIPASPAQEEDPTGAGDVFGVVFALAMARGRSPEDAARLAAHAAASVVEGPGLGRLNASSLHL